MIASSKLKRRWRWRLSPRTLTPSAVQTVKVCPMIVMFGLVGSLAGGQRGKPVCWWNVSCRWWRVEWPCRKCTVELAASEADDTTRWLMPISCHFRDCKALLVTSLTHVSGAITSVQTFTFTLLKITSHKANTAIDASQNFKSAADTPLLKITLHKFKTSFPPS